MLRSLDLQNDILILILAVPGRMTMFYKYSLRVSMKRSSWCDKCECSWLHN